MGYPKQEALEFIQKHEGYDRAYYAGFFGFETEGEAQFFVNIRSMQLFADATVLYAGGGITKDSDTESEWQETEMKLQTLARAISC